MRINKKIAMHLSMLNRVVNYLLNADYVSITESIPAFYAATNEVQAQIVILYNLLTEYGEVITGIAVQKREARTALAQTSYQIMSSVRSYALANDNDVLAAQMKTSLSKLSYMKFSTLAVVVNQAIGVVEPLVGSLSDYNVTSTNLTDWQTALTNYNAILEGPQEAITQRKAILAQIKITLGATVALMDGQMDTLATNFIDDEPLYYAAYLTKRKLIHTVTVPVTPALRIYVKNQLGMAITQGEVIIPATDKSAFLDTNGHAFIEKIPAGPQMITITTPAGTNTYGPYDFVEKHIVKLTFHIGTTSETKATVTVTKEKVTESAVEEK